MMSCNRLFVLLAGSVLVTSGLPACYVGDDTVPTDDGSGLSSAADDDWGDDFGADTPEADDAVSAVDPSAFGQSQLASTDDPNAEPDFDGEVLDTEPELDDASEAEADLADDAAVEPVSLLDTAGEDGDGGDEETVDEESPDLDDTAASQTPLVTPNVLAQIPTKIKYVLVIVKENHTFDNYFTGFPGATSSKFAFKWNGHKRVKKLRPKAPPNTLASSPKHVHSAAVAAYRHGHMDGFSVNPGRTPYIRYTRHQIPFYWKYASEYVLADHLFSESLAPSAPGHEVFWFGRSTTINNPSCHLPGGDGCGAGCTGTHLSVTTFNERTGKTKKVKPCFALPSLPDHLPAGFTWFDYGAPLAKMIKSQRNVDPAKHYGSSKKLLKDLTNHKLHNLMIAHVTGGEISEHPPEGPCKGERFSTQVINAAMQLPEWNEMAIIVTWDDWGGFYDHVKPPVHKSNNGAIYGRGFRLPLMIISPYAKKGHIIKHRTEQASVPRLIEELWGMDFMTARNKHARDGVAGSLMGAFDFTQQPRPPMLLTPRSCPGD